MVLSADGKIIYFLGRINSNKAICRFYLDSNTTDNMQVPDSSASYGVFTIDVSDKLYATFPNNDYDAQRFMKLNPDTGISDWHVQYAWRGSNCGLYYSSVTLNKAQDKVYFVFREYSSPTWYQIFVSLNSSNGELIGNQYQFSQSTYGAESMIIIGSKIYFTHNRGDASGYYLSSYDTTNDQFIKIVFSGYDNLMTRGEEGM